MTDLLPPALAAVRPGHLVMVDLPGPDLDEDTAAYLARHEIRGVCLFGKNVQSEAQLRTLCTDLRRVMGPDALIALDHEGGAILRPTFWPFAPSAMLLGAADDPQLTEDVHAALARQLRSVGINWNFTPVLDVNVNPANPVIGERAFGADPALVTRHGRASLAGHAREGVAACAKHFPGHGDTNLDSHLALPIVRKDRADLEAGEFAPFRALLPGTPALMTAHIVYPALDPVYPATLSRAILTGLLRDEWGYEGVVITDSMGMQAIDANFGRGEAAVLSLRAGADMIMALGRREAQEASLNAIESALEGGALDPAALSRSRERLSALARQCPAQADPALNPEADRELLTRAWAAGLSVTGSPRPPAPGTAVTLIAHLTPQRENVSEAAADAETLARELSAVYEVHLTPFETPDQIDWDAARAPGRPVILATTGRHRHPALVGVRPDLHVALYNPYTALDVQAPAVITYGFRPEARAALIAWLRGDLTPTGTLPFAAPPEA